MPRITLLPYDIIIERHSCTHTSLSSGLRHELVDTSVEFDPYGEVATHAIESLLLALVAEGVALVEPAASRAVVTAAEAIAEYLVRLVD